MYATTDFHIQPGGELTGQARVPGDKSISHRAVMLGALADGETRVEGFLEGADALATIAAFRALGVAIAGPEKGHLVIQGVGLHGLRPAEQGIDLGNSGTSMRLLCGLLAGQAFATTLAGDTSLNRRPMARVITPLTTMGAAIDSGAGGVPPLHIAGGRPLQGIHYELPVASAQVKSCLLLAGLYANGTTRVTEPAATRDHSERMLAGFGYPVGRDGATVAITGGGTLTGGDVKVPADISSAAFFLVGASMAAGSELILEGVGVNPTRTGVIEILRRMGAAIECRNEREVAGEPIADLRVRAAPLHGIRMPRDLVPLAIDEFPAIFIAAAAATGETVLEGAEELRVKESDRIQVMADGLQTLGVIADPTPDGIRIQGGALAGGVVDAAGDHRIAMAFAMAGLVASGPVTVRDCANVDTSFPGFAELASETGLGITVCRAEAQ